MCSKIEFEGMYSARWGDIDRNVSDFGWGSLGYDIDAKNNKMDAMAYELERKQEALDRSLLEEQKLRKQVEELKKKLKDKEHAAKHCSDLLQVAKRYTDAMIPEPTKPRERRRDASE
eukprot:g5610.t1